jgi:hypothetical protein
LSSIKPPDIRFSGYELMKNNQAKLFLPGHSNDRVTAEVIFPDAPKPIEVPLKQQGGYWKSDLLPSGVAYRFKVNDKPEIAAQMVQIKDKKPISKPVVFQKQDDYWEPSEPVPEGVKVTYRIPIAGNPRLRVEKRSPDRSPETVPLVRDGNDWTFSTDEGAPEGTTYRLVHGLDCLEVVQDSRHGAFNRVAEQGTNAPQKSVVLADIFQDSILTKRRLQALEKQEREQRGLPPLDWDQPHVPILSMANHFTRHATGPGGGHEEGLTELMPELQKAGFSGLVFKPFIGGDTLSSHGYGTVDQGVLNNSFQNKRAFRAFLGDSLKRGMKIFADGAFVNQGLNGVQMMSNMAYGFSSPYWRWMKYGDERKPGGPVTFPSLAHNKFVFGVLPTAKDPETGFHTVDYSRFDFRIINDPAAPAGQYDDKRPTFIELFDPRLEHKDGSIIRKPETVLLTGHDSVQKLRFPVSVDELKQKRASLKQGHEKEAFLEWKRFRLDKGTSDDSGMKWDGQASVAMLNPKNPDVVNHLSDMVGYWSRMVMNTHVNTVTRALTEARQRLNTDDPAQLLQDITQNNPFELSPNSDKVLPAIINREVEAITADEAKAVRDRVQPECTSQETGAVFSKRLLHEIPMSVLPLPVLFKATLGYPGLQTALQSKYNSKLGKWIDRYILAPLSWIPLIGRAFQGIRDALFPPTFEQRLGGTLGQIFQQLSPKTQEKLRYGNMQSQLADQLGERLYLSLLTGLSLNEVKAKESDSKALEDAFYKGMPGNILKADPHTAAKLLPRLMKERLDTLKPVEVAAQVEDSLGDLDPGLAALAQEVVQRRELGLNWRIDAAKDVSEMNRIYEAQPAARPKMFQEEIKFMEKFWGQLVKRMREPFPKASIIAELTDFDRLSNQNKPIADEAMKTLLGSKTFTSTPNMTYLYSSLLQLVNYAQRPDEYGLTQMTPSEFMGNIRGMSEAVPASALQQYQNLTSSHDYTTTSHALLINPDLFNMDLLKWWGLKDDFRVAADELRSKPCFDVVRQNLANAGLNQKKLNNVLEELTDIAADSDLQKRLGSESVKTFFDEYSKKADNVAWRATSHDQKGKFVEQLFQALKPEDIDLENREQMNQLQAALQARITEHSETKAMRGAIMNAARQLNWNNAPDGVRQQAEQALWDALDGAAKQWQRHFGYQSLDSALNHVFEKLDSKQLPAALQAPEAQEQWKLALYTQAMQPVMANLKKVFAIQNALPGNPSVYLPDLFAQGGGEWTKNTFCQDRNLIRVDKLQDPQYRQFLDEVSSIFRTRSNPDLQVLNNGTVLPVTPDDENGVLPIVRDNGHQQVITLVNVGKPQPLDWKHKAGVGSQYATVQRKLERNLENGSYQPDLSELHLQPGTRYHDVYSNEAFVLNQDGKLVSANNPDEGIRLTDWRMLVRENSPLANLDEL